MQPYVPHMCFWANGGHLRKILLPILGSLLCLSARAVSLPRNLTDVTERGPNLVMILADDLGYGDLGSYGQKMIRTPNLDRMAREGVRFTNFYAGSPVCAPSRCSLMTGLHQGHAYIRGNSTLVPVPG